MLTIPEKDIRSRIFANAKNLKAAGGKFSRIYVKRDVHPGMRKEWQGLLEAKAKEKGRPEYEIRLDTRQRIIMT